MAFTNVSVQINLPNVTGTAIFTLMRQMRNGNQIVPQGTQYKTAVKVGQTSSVVVPATTDPDTTVLGCGEAYYQVQIEHTGVGPDKWNVSVPHTSPTVQLTALPLVAPTPVGNTAAASVAYVDQVVAGISGASITGTSGVWGWDTGTSTFVPADPGKTFSDYGSIIFFGPTEQQGAAEALITPSGKDWFYVVRGTGAIGGGVADHGLLTGLDDPADHIWAALVDASRPFTNRISTPGVTVPNDALPASPAANAGVILSANADKLYLTAPGRSPEVFVRGAMGFPKMELNQAGDDYVWVGGVAPDVDSYSMVLYVGTLDPKNAVTNKPSALPAGKTALWAQPEAAPGTAQPIQERQKVSVGSPTTSVTFVDFATAAAGNYLVGVITARAITADPDAVNFTTTGAAKPATLIKKVISGNSAIWLYALATASDGTETGLSVTTGGRTYDRLMAQELTGVNVAAPWSTWEDQSFASQINWTAAGTTVVANTAEDRVVALVVFDEQVQNVYAPSGSYADHLGGAGTVAVPPSFKLWASYASGLIGYAKPGAGANASLVMNWVTPATTGAASFARLNSKVA